MAGKWRDTVVQEVGRERYDELSAQLGGDLAYAYIEHRMEQLMIDRLVKERMPKSSADYIIRKAAQSSLLGLSQTLSRSPLAEEIEARGEAAYRPGKLEKAQGAYWAHLRMPSCWAVSGRGPHWQGSSGQTWLSRPSPRTSSLRSPKHCLWNSASARGCSAANEMFSTASARRLRQCGQGKARF